MAIALPRGGGARLWRYNYKVLMGTGYWILVLPVAISQIVTLWMMVLAADFSFVAAARIAELMTPLLGAFLAAQALAPEYRSGVGAVLASKPLSLHRVLTVRVTLALLAGLLLSAISLGICTTLGQPINVPPLLLAAVPGLWFLSLVALTFATVFRNSLGGFAVAAGVWALDYAVGYGVHPLLSLQGFTASVAEDQLAVLWKWSKAALVIGGFLLLLVHSRILPRICRPPQKADLARILLVTLAVALAYALSGAAIMLGYAYLHRANLPRNDVIWLRTQLRPYGAIPIARVFGPAFATYVAEPPVVTSEGQSQAALRLKELENALARYPRSIWADSIAFALGWEQEKVSPPAAAATYLAVADRYGSSPFAPRALASILRLPPGTAGDAERLLAARRLLSDYPASTDAEKGAAHLLALYPATVGHGEMAEAARVAAQSAQEAYRPGWWLVHAQAQQAQGKTAEAREAAQRARTEADRLLTEIRQRTARGQEMAPHLSRLSGVAAQANALLNGGG